MPQQFDAFARWITIVLLGPSGPRSSTASKTFVNQMSVSVAASSISKRSEMSNTPRYSASLTPDTSHSSQLVATPRPVPSSFAGHQRISSTKSNEIYKMPCLSLETSTSTRNFVPEAAQRKWPSPSVSQKRQRRSPVSSPGPINLLRRPWKSSRERSSKIVAETPSKF